MSAHIEGQRGANHRVRLMPFPDAVLRRQVMAAMRARNAGGGWSR